MTSPVSPPLAEFERRRQELAEAVQRSKALIEEARAQRAQRQGAASAARPAGPSDTVVAFRTFKRLLDGEGIRPALYSLLRLTDYRFISIFRFSNGKATSVVHVDRDDLSALQAAEVPDTATYCCYVRDGNGAFVTADALLDPRTANHAAREAVRAYCGVPIMDPEGGLIGTLCHYDLSPQDPEQLDVELLVQAASALAQSGRVPAYPAGD